MEHARRDEGRSVKKRRGTLKKKEIGRGEGRKEEER